jgi:hypothetical protein
MNRTLLLSTATTLLPAASWAQAATPSSVDLSPVVQPLLAVIGTVIAGLLAIYVPKALAAFQTYTGIQLTDQQRAVILGAVQTAAGNLETQLDQGALKVAHINIANATVRSEAVAAINAVPDAMAALNMTTDGVARMIVGAVDTAAHGQAALGLPPLGVNAVQGPATAAALPTAVAAPVGGMPPNPPVAVV